MESTTIKLHQFTVLVSMLVTGLLQINGQCPSAYQAPSEIAFCISQLNALTDFTKGPIPASQLNNYCTSSARNTEVQCAENIINACKETDENARRTLEKTININAIKSSVNILCRSTEVFMEKQACIGQYQTTVTGCTKEKMLSYMAKVQSLKVKTSSKGDEWFEENAYEALCDYVGEVSGCQRPYGRNCGREIGDVFDALMHAATPPVCAGVMEHANLILLFSLALVALIVKGKL